MYVCMYVGSVSGERVRVLPPESAILVEARRGSRGHHELAAAVGQVGECVCMYIYMYLCTYVCS